MNKAQTRDNLMTLHGELTNKAFSIFEAKNHDYTGGNAGDNPFANFTATEVLGVPAELGVLVRCMDKFQRIRAFVSKGELKVKNESVEDSIIDVINYMVLLGGLVRREKAGTSEGQEVEVCSHCGCYRSLGSRCSCTVPLIDHGIPATQEDTPGEVVPKGRKIEAECGFTIFHSHDTVRRPLNPDGTQSNPVIGY